MESKKLRVAWFSELSASDSLSAYFSRALLPFLKDKFDITLYHNSFEKISGFNTEHYLKAFELNNKEAYDIFFYQLEDGNRYNFIRSHIGLMPGVTYFHHFNLSTYGPEPLLNSPYSDVIAKFNGVVDYWPDRKKKYKPKGPAAFREAMLSPVAVFSTPQSLNEYRHQVKEILGAKDEVKINAFYLPYPVSVPPSKSKCSSPDLQICFLGSTRIENRAHKVLSALKRLDRPYKLSWMLKAEEKIQAEDLLEEHGIANANLIFKSSPEDWRHLVSESNVAIHTLFSVYGHNQPYLGISMSEGCPSIVTNFASNETLPDNVVIKVQPGDSEALQIYEAIKAISEVPALTSPELLKRYVLDNLEPRQIASELSSIFLKRKDFLRDLNRRWQVLLSSAKESLIEESQGFLQNDYSLNSQIKPFFEELGWR